MKKLKLLLGMIVLTAFVLAACSPNQPAENLLEDQVDEGSTDQADNQLEISDNLPQENQSASEAPTEEPVEESEDGGENNEVVEAEPEEPGLENKPAWYSHEFTDAATKETFTINGFVGKVVLVETLMFQCTECLEHQQAIKEMISLLGERDDFVAISINISPEEDLFWAEGWVEQYGFDWLYGDAPAEIALEIGGSLGRDFLNPSTMPIVIFDKEGFPHILPPGPKSAETLLAFVEDFLN